MRDVEVIGQGWESEILGLTCKLPTGPVDLVLRMYTGAGGSKKAAVEGAGMPKLFDAEYPVPRVYHTQAAPEPLGLPFIIMERVTGTELWRHSQTPSGPAAIGLETEFIDLLVELHRVPVGPFLTGEEDGDPRRFVYRMLASWRAAADAAAPRVMSDALDWFDQRASGVDPLPPSVTHNDFHPGNILRDDTGKLTVVDWTGLAVADPRSDLAWTLLLRETYGAPGASDRERDRYASQLPIPDMDFFEAAARLRRLLSLTVSLTLGPEALGMRSGAEDQMRQELRQSTASYERFVAITGQRLPAYERLAEAQDS